MKSINKYHPPLTTTDQEATMLAKLFKRTRNDHIAFGLEWKNIEIEAHDEIPYPREKAPIRLSCYTYSLKYFRSKRTITLDLDYGVNEVIFDQGTRSPETTSSILGIIGTVGGRERKKPLAYVVGSDPYHLTIYASDLVHEESLRPIAEMILRRIGDELCLPYDILEVEEIGEEGVDVQLGADVEFEFAREGQIVDLRFEDVIACRTPWGEVGIDGSRHQYELRPCPSEDAAILYDRIRHMAETIVERRGGKLCLSGNNFPLGAHIHIGPLSQGQRVHPTRDVVAAIDDAVGALVYLSGSARGGYRSRRAIRVQFHGGFEYRTLPSAILVTKDVFSAVTDTLYRVLTCRPHRNLCPEDFPRLKFLQEMAADYSFEYEPVTSIQPNVRAEANERVLTMLNSLRFPFPLTIVGGKKERGKVTNWEHVARVMGWEYQPDLPIRSTYLCLPHSFRFTSNLDEIERFKYAVDYNNIPETSF